MDTDFSASVEASFLATQDASFNASLGVIDGLKRIILRGVAIDTSVNRNNWQVPEDELEGIAERLVGAQIRIDHSQSIRDVKGRIIKTELDQPHDVTKELWDRPNPSPHIHYEAEIVSNEANILIPILQGYVDHGSIGVDSKFVFCSQCGESTRPGKTCECEGSWEVVRNARVNEYSLVSSPAYERTAFIPYEASKKKEDSTDKEDDTECKCESEKECDGTKEECDKVEEIDKNREISQDEGVDRMAEEDNKIDILMGMVQELSASYKESSDLVKELTASNQELLTRIAAIEKEAAEEEDEDEKKKKEAADEGEGAGTTEETASEDDDEEEEKKACSCGGKKASKKKASNGMKETPGERGDPSGEEKKVVKKSPIEAGVIIGSEFNSQSKKPVDTMETAMNEIFGFAAKLNIYPLELH
jgi:hypothetical protein